ncbi:hypothetical protein RHGRI_009442 [Rhododendron griersonianum]|uniref:FRIGIDA-like protein n=1 Tax=Rhododendron griersonianum TaxID=479676 RepID=A0AAV6KFE8_9ERIC|nr:hypothetical protein RHGRI_009442 [Rhododendron griersonianum]
MEDMETTLKTVSAELKLVDSKKENLRKAFQHLQSNHHPSSSLSFPALNALTWPDLDSHFSSLHSSLLSQFHLLQHQHQHQSRQQTPEQAQSHPCKQTPIQPSEPNPIQPQLEPPKANPIQPTLQPYEPVPIQPTLQPSKASPIRQLSKPIPVQTQTGPPNKPLPNPRRSSSAIVLKDSSTHGSGTVYVGPELKFLCEKMDGPGLRDYVAENYSRVSELRAELASALSGHAQDAAAMVLDAMEGFYWRSSCVVLLEVLTVLKLEIRGEVRERAEKLAAEWRGKVGGSAEGAKPMEAFAFLNLVAAFGLVGGVGFGWEDLVDFAACTAFYKRAAELFRVLGFGERMSDLVLKLITKGQPYMAFKIIYEFELTDKFPPVPVLKDCVVESKRLAAKIRQDGHFSLQSLKKARNEEISALKFAIKVINAYNLESEYPKYNLVKRIEKLEKKKFASASLSKPQQQSKPQKLSGSKRFQTSGLAYVPNIKPTAQAEMKSFCEKMDGLGLRNYIAEQYRERTAIRIKLPHPLRHALRHAPDAAGMVLDAMEGFYSPNSKGDKDKVLRVVRIICVALLEELMGLKPEISAEVKGRAKKLAVEWRGKVNVDGENPLEAFGFLNLVGAFGLVNVFSTEDLVDIAVVVAKYEQATHLCRVLGFGDRISDLITKLISRGKQLEMIKFIFEFELTEKFPPVLVLNEYVESSKKLAVKIREDGCYSFDSLEEARTKEVSALKSAIEIIQVHKLESEYPKENLARRITELERERFSSGPASKPQQQSIPQRLSGNKRSRTTAPTGLASIPNSNAATTSASPAFQQSQLHPEGLLPDHPALGFPGNLMSTQQYAPPSESHTPAVYFDRPVANGGYGFPHQHHLSYYPQ